ncbi:MAG: hypothetical protein WB866_06785 [Solirubrobacterales bacterium]|jgi:hypothetical protein
MVDALAVGLHSGSEAKRAMIQANIKDTKKRLKKRGCKPVSR